MSSSEDFSNVPTFQYDYIQYLIQYSGFVNNRLMISDGIYLGKINDQYAIISFHRTVLKGIFDKDIVFDLLTEKIKIKGFSFIVISVISLELYTLLDVSPSNIANTSVFQNQFALDLTGHGVVTGLIDTGIDYLNEEFMDSSGHTKILEIWDQTIETQPNVNDSIPFGTIYTSEQIQSAIEAHRAGKNPYDIVPMKDTNGHGTNMAGIIAGRGVNKDFRGIAPNCNLVIVKLLEYYPFLATQTTLVPVYNVSVIIAAIEYLKTYVFHNLKPIAIHLPLGTTLGNHKGISTLDNYLLTVLNNIGIILVTGSGNEGGNDGHVTGTIVNTGEYKIINLIVAPNQTNIYIEIWIGLPNIISVNVLSPSGEETGTIIPTINSKRNQEFVFENTKIFIKYYIPDETSGDELIGIYLFDLKPGVWRIKLTLELGKDAEFNAWLPQMGITHPGTRFSPSEPYGTLTIPGDSPNVITVSAYDQTNNTILEYSGLGFRNDNITRIQLAAGGTNVLTVGLNNKMVAVSGSCVASAVVTGLCVLLLQWGIVEKKYPYMYTQSIITFLTRGTIQPKGDIYPNPRWGYGIIDFNKVFESIT